MKHTLFILSLSTIFFASCTNSDKPAEESKTTTETTSPTTEMSAGENLISKSDCVGCHNKTNKIVGPAYVEIAAKYPLSDENVELLADKIINGGTGVWGQVPMTAHPTISKKEAKEMSRYILSIKK